MPALVDLNKKLGETEIKSRDVVDAVNAFLKEGDYYLINRPATQWKEAYVELIPASSEAFAAKTKLDVLLAELTADQRQTRSEREYGYIASAGYSLRVCSLGQDEWEVVVVTRRGELSSRFIDA